MFDVFEIHNDYICRRTINTFRVRRSRGEMYIGHGCLCICVSVCLSVPRRIPTLLHGPGCNDRGAPVPCSCVLLGGFATELCRLRYDMFGPFGTIRACNRQPDRQATDHSIYRATVASPGKNWIFIQVP